MFFTVIKELLEANRDSTVKAVKRIDAVLQRIGLVMPFSTRSTVNHSDITPNTLSNILLQIF